MEKEQTARVHSILGRILKDFDAFCMEHGLTYWVDAGTLLGAVRHGGFIPWDDDCDVVMLRKDFNRLMELRNKLPDYVFLDSYFTNKKCVRMMSRLTHRYSQAREHGVSNPGGIFVDILIFDNMMPDGSLPKGFYLCKRMNELSAMNRWDAAKQPVRSPKQLAIKLLGYIFYIPNRFFPTWHVRLFKGKVDKYTSIAEQLDTPIISYGYELPWQGWPFEKAWIFPIQRIPFEDFTVNAPANTDTYLKYLYGDDYMTPLAEDQRKPHYAEVEFFDEPEEH